MADRIDDVIRRLEELEQTVRALRRAQRDVLGSRQQPISLVYLFDDRTGAVAEVRYDRENAALRTKEVR